ncbi:Uncharacterised protein at_DN1027 [Pycnogonum litorale]
MNLVEPGVLKLAATATTGFFAGGAIYVSLSEYPALCELNEIERLRAFLPTYKHASKIQPFWIISTLASCVGSYLLSDPAERNYMWIGCGAALASIMPYTVIFMSRIYHSLIDLETSTKKSNDWINGTFSKWARAHHARSVVSTAVFGAMLYGLWKDM